MLEESNPRIPRKKGQPANSKKHSDLYTDENPKGTIHGLGFKDVATAKASVSKIRNSSRSHAHKIQAAVAMEQRAREMGKTSEAAVYRKFINTMKKKTKKMNEEKHGDHEPEMIRSQLKTAGRASKRIEKHSRKKDNFKAWVQSKITKASDYLDTAADYLDSKDMKKEAANPAQQAAIAINMKKEGKKPKKMNESKRVEKIISQLKNSSKMHKAQAQKLEKELDEGSLHKWFKGSKSKDGKGGWVNVVTGGTCASDEPGEGTPKCVSSSKRASMTKAERLSAARRKKKADPGQQSKTGAAKPTYVSTDSPRKKKQQTEEVVSEKVGGAGTLVRQGVKVGGKTGGRVVQKGTTAATQAGKAQVAKAQQGNQSKMVGSGKFEKAGAFVGGALGGAAGVAIPDGPAMVAGELAGGYAGSKIGGKIGRQIDKIGAKKKMKEEVVTEADKKGKGSGTKDACYHKVKSRYSVWPSAYASGALVKCRKKGAANWGNSSKKESYSWRDDFEYVQEGAAWTKKEGKNKSGGLNEKGRKSYERDNPGSDLKAPSKKVGNPRRASFCARMKGMKKKLTSAKTARDPDSRINKSLRAWNCDYQPQGNYIKEDMPANSVGGGNIAGLPPDEPPVKKKKKKYMSLGRGSRKAWMT